MAATHDLVEPQQRLRRRIVRLVTTSVIHGSRAGESHGAVYIIDLEKQRARQALDWNTPNIDRSAVGGERGLRGIAFDAETIYIAASDELLAFTPDLRPVGSWRNPFLKHCNEIMVWKRILYLSSTGFDSVLGFDLDEQAFTWAINIRSANFRFSAERFDPMGDEGPLPMDKQHIDSVFCSEHGMYITGSRTGGMLHFNGRDVNMAVQLPSGTHNARPFRDGVLFNDTEAGALRYTGRGEGEEDRAMRVPQYDPQDLEHMDDEPIARQGFARGLCVLSDNIVVGGSSPATVSVYDLAANNALGSVRLSPDVRNTVHSIAEWPFG